ncbi:hypothetical protein B9T07_16090 [Limnospira fusiformis CCALA 023]|uniref:carboxypeptidase regulatory-like domain-containing protein n=1 Tax=Oscillatoriales TaxID=1150 RepID=UPI00396E93AB
MNWKLCISLLFWTIAIPESAIAHGVIVQSQTTSAIKINAAYDSGTPMVNAEVRIYTPQDPSTPWMTGNTDDNGQFLFIPDHDNSGLWEATVRQAGHGALIAIPVSPPGEQVSDSTQNAIASNSASSPVQKWVAAAAVIWGFIGTALFFTRLKPSDDVGDDSPHITSQESQN